MRDTLHQRQYLLLLQSPTHDLQADRRAVEHLRVICDGDTYLSARALQEPLRGAPIFSPGQSERWLSWWEGLTFLPQRPVLVAEWFVRIAWIDLLVDLGDGEAAGRVVE